MKSKLMITGSFPPDICGVGDYVCCFMSTKAASDWTLYSSSDWSLSLLRKKIREINRFNSKSIFLQYPTQGYGWSLLPQIICIYYSLFTKKKFVVVLHEFSQRKFKAKLATLFLLLANNIIFTNDFEKEYAKKIVPFASKRFLTIKILSNIKSVVLLNNWSQRHYDLMYFGHIRPNKGLEDFLDTAMDLQRERKLKVAVVGQVLPEFYSYFEELQGRSNLEDVDYFLNKDVDIVSSFLNSAKIIFLPFPDGISERRGSFLASIANGALVVSYRGKFATTALEKVCFFTSLKTAVDDISNLLCTTDDNNYAERLIFQKEYFLKELPHSWDEVVRLYNNIVD